MRRNVRTCKAKNHAPAQLQAEVVYYQNREKSFDNRIWDVHYSAQARDHVTLGTPDAPLFLIIRHNQG